MIARYVWLSILTLVFSATSFFTKSLATSHLEWVSSLLSNLGAGFAASLLTVILIDRKIEAAREIQTNRVQQVAFARLRPALLNHVQFLFNLHKASVTEMPSTAPITIADLFSEKFYDSVRYLDFARQAPATPPRDWYAFSDQQCRSFKDVLDGVSDTYATFLDAETIEVLGELQNSGLCSLLMQFPLMQALDRAENLRRVNNQLYDPGMAAIVRSHVGSVLKLVDQADRQSKQPIRLADVITWRNDVSPVIGSARLDPDAIDLLRSQVR